MPLDLKNMTVKEASDILAKRACAVRMVKKAGLKKTGAAAPAAPANPYAVGGDSLLAGLAGAGIGGGIGMASDYMNDEPGREKHPWRSALTGALAGGAIGGGLHYGLKQLGNYMNPPDGSATKNLQQAQELNNAQQDAAWQGHSNAVKLMTDFPRGLNDMISNAGSNVGLGIGGLASWNLVGRPAYNAAMNNLHKGVDWLGLRGGIDSMVNTDAFMKGIEGKVPPAVYKTLVDGGRNVQLAAIRAMNPSSPVSDYSKFTPEQTKLLQDTAASHGLGDMSKSTMLANSTGQTRANHVASATQFLRDLYDHEQQGGVGSGSNMPDYATRADAFHRLFNDHMATGPAAPTPQSAGILNTVQRLAADPKSPFPTDIMANVNAELPLGIHGEALPGVLSAGRGLAKPSLWSRGGGTGAQIAATLAGPLLLGKGYDPYVQQRNATLASHQQYMQEHPEAQAILDKLHAARQHQ